jgi:hypothetical protein
MSDPLLSHETVHPTPGVDVLGVCAMPAVRKPRLCRPPSGRCNPGFWTTGIAHTLTNSVPVAGCTVSCDTGGPAMSVAIAAAELFVSQQGFDLGKQGRISPPPWRVAGAEVETMPSRAMWM